MFDCYYCIEIQCDARKPESSKKMNPYICTFCGQKSMETARFLPVFWKRRFQGKYQLRAWRHVFTFATVHVTDADVTFWDGPGMLTVKAAKQVYNRCESPC